MKQIEIPTEDEDSATELINKLCIELGQLDILGMNCVLFKEGLVWYQNLGSVKTYNEYKAYAHAKGGRLLTLTEARELLK